MLTLKEKLERHIIHGAESDDCWGWSGSLSHGYGRIMRGGRGSAFVTAPRASYEVFVGPVPTELEVCHTCDNRACCNPRHLFLATHRENMIDMAKKLRSPRRRLDLSQVHDIRARYASGSTQTEVGRDFGISRVQVKNIVTRRQWAFA